VEQVRFCNSGTEATLNAIRAARAFTGRDKILKMEGGYHGSHETVEVSISPGLSEAGPAKRPLPVAEGAGISRAVLGDVIVAPFNDLTATASLIREERDHLAAVIIEPMLGSTGMIPATHEFLRGVRAVTRECNVLLIADEVITFRLDWGGAQAIYDIEPDLTAFAKIIGGGFPVGAFGGRRDIMALFSPTGSRISHSGTFNGNPVTMAAGVAAMQLLTKQEIARINTLGERLARGMREAFDEVGLVGQVTGMGSTLNVHLTPLPVVDYRSGATVAKKASWLLHLALLNRGVFSVPRGMFCISTPMDNQIVDDTIIRFTDALKQVRPALERRE
jgi:glutamate-1-semialdehyde 2,1-aminomutase